MEKAATKCLIKFQIGPVQEFIAQARSTRDLWSGSYLLSWLVAAGIKALPDGSHLIFPQKDKQPLLEAILDPQAEGILIPNLPNIFIAQIQGDAKDAGHAVEAAIEAEWKAIADAVWAAHPKLGIEKHYEARFFAQVNHHLSISWVATPLVDKAPEGYKAAYLLNGKHLDAVRQTRAFHAWDSASGINDKDSLSGKEEAIFRGSGEPNQSDVWHNLLNKHTDFLGAVAVIKRVWHLAYLNREKGLPTGSEEFPIRSIPAIAARTTELDDKAPRQEDSPGDNYIAAIAFDGDRIGEWVNGDKSPRDTDLRVHHEAFSQALTGFALGSVSGIVTTLQDGKGKNGGATKVPLGQLIYAGGDDVVCLVPADEALAVATLLRDAFRRATEKTESAGDTPDASVGIAIAHIHAPLQDLIRAAQAAEKHAKNEVGRPAFSVSLMKRSGSITHWGAKWESGAMALHDSIFKAMKDGDLSAKFPHRVCQLLEPYLTRRTGLSNQADVPAFPIHEIIQKEFIHAATRQGSREIAHLLEVPLRTYLANLGTEPQICLKAIIGLCTTLAFTFRNLPEKPTTAERHAHA